MLIEDILDRWKYLRGNRRQSIHDEEIIDPWQSQALETEIVVTVTEG